MLPFLVPGAIRIWAIVVPVTVAVGLVELAAGIAARVRIPDAAVLIAVHDVDRADEILDALRAAAIPAAATGLLARALFRFFGPFVPVVIRVPASRLDEAVARVARPR
jgi:hypothetical protein